VALERRELRLKLPFIISICNKVGYYAAAYTICFLTLSGAVMAGRRNRAHGEGRSVSATSAGSAIGVPALPLVRPAKGQTVSDPKSLLNLCRNVGPSGLAKPSQPDRLNSTHSAG